MSDVIFKKFNLIKTTPINKVLSLIIMIKEVDE